MDEFAERIKLGEPIGFSSNTTNLNIHPITDRVAWLTYQDETKVGRGGMLVNEIKSKCSALVRKKEETWVIFHEHCSTINEYLEDKLSSTINEHAFLSQSLFSSVQNCPIVGNQKSHIYHAPGGQHYRGMLSSQDGVSLKSEQEAQKSGFRRSLR